VTDSNQLSYARQKTQHSSHPIQRVFVMAVLANTAIFSPSAVFWKLLANRPEQSGGRSICADALGYTFAAYGVLFFVSLLILLAQRRQPRSWAFVLSAVFCALMGCAGLCADVMGH